MNTNMQFDRNGNMAETAAISKEQAARAFVTQVFTWMFAGLLLTAAISYAFASNASFLISLMFNPETGRPTAIFWISAFSPIALSLTMSFAFERLSLAVMIGLFALYASVIGFSISVIGLMYEPMMIAKAFGLTAGTFGIMAVMGYTTKADLSKLGSILGVAFLGVFILSFLNLFVFKSSGMSWLIDIVFLVIIVGIVAWKMQMIRKMGEEIGTTQPKMAVYMAMTIYTTFINLFMTILRLLGNRR
jgi:uncharacterized protein